MVAIDEQIARLRAAIAAFEAQRPALSDAVVEAGLAPLRERLAVLLARPATIEQQRKLATVLFMDVVDHTRMVRDLDPEETMALMDPILARLAEPVIRHGGRIARYQGDGFKAVFGLPVAHEDDPENAVRAALAIQATARAIAKEWEAGETPAIRAAEWIAGVPPAEPNAGGSAARLQIRVGLDTGSVFAGGLTEGVDTVTGMTVNLAARLETAAAPDTILISHNTYRHIRGVFDVQPREPIAVKGVEGLAQTYVVLRAKPRAFRRMTRGVEGIETRMIGRDRELDRLREAYAGAMHTGVPRVVTIVGDAGVGKSRLLYEFDNWIELRPESVRYFKGRARLGLQRVPYGLFRDLFAFRFDILDDDPTAVALEKFRAGMAGYLPPESADVVGHWLGFDFSSSEAVQPLLGGAGFEAIARAHLTRYLRALAAPLEPAESDRGRASEGAGEGAANQGHLPVVMLLEDIHWADDSSLDLVAHLATTLGATDKQQVCLLFVAAARPTLFERRPDWGAAGELFWQVNLSPLSREASRVLVTEVLQRVAEPPEQLRELIVNAAEGNPFYVEELVKMLIEQGVIERPFASLPAGEDDHPLAAPREPGEGAWQVRPAKLEGLRVPATLAGLLQARLDGLPESEREVLRRASVVGRIFWDDAVADLLQASRETVHPILESLRRRELIYRSEHSSFANVEEYFFKHALLRDVAYETVLLKHRAEYHGCVARWLETRARERQGEYLGLIAEHYVQAGEGVKAAALLERSGEEALRVGAAAAARRTLGRGLSLRAAAGEMSGPAVTRALLGFSRACHTLGDLPAAGEALERALAGAREAGDVAAEAEALSGLAAIANTRGQYERARELAEASLPLARAVGGSTLALTLTMAAYATWSTGDLASAEAYGLEALTASRALGAVAIEIDALNVLGNITTSCQQLDRAAEFSRASLELARQAHHLSFESRALLNLGYLLYLLGDFAGARAYSLEALERGRELGGRLQIAIVLGNLAQVDVKLGDTAAARAEAREALALADELGYLPAVVNGVSLFGQIIAAEGALPQALALFGLAYAHPALEHQLQLEIDDELARLGLPPDELAAGLAAGAALDFETVVQEILNGQW